MPTTSSNPLSGYTSIENGTKIQFKSGLQTDLNTMINVGNAIEGTFYLTTDTHKLYIGRKSKTVKRTDSGHTDEYKVIPEQVSRGVTVVGTASELPTEFPVDAPAGAIEEGELYYVTDSNILAALREKKQSNGTSYNPKQYQWVQVNSPTGITSISTGATNVSNDVVVTTEISTAAGTKTGKTKFKAGNNITLTANSTETLNPQNATAASGFETGVFTISATDTTYTIGTETTTTNANAYSTSAAYAVGDKVKKDNECYECISAIASGGEAWNASHWRKITGAVVELKTNGSDTNSANTKINIKGVNTVGVSSDANGSITVTGPTFDSISVAGKTGANTGMEIALGYTNGNTGSASSVTGSFDPQITYGVVGSKSSAHFKSTSAGANIIADLDVYTKDQADTAISNAITNHLAAADAMTYKGTVNSANDLEGKIRTNGAHNGDVYKVANASSGIQVGSVVAQLGDLIILTGTEANSSTHCLNVTVNNTDVEVVPNSTATTVPASSLHSLYELIPSGNEPKIQVDICGNNATGTTGNAAPFVTLYDGNNSGTADSANLVTTRYLSGNLITVTSNVPGQTSTDWIKKSSGADLGLVFSHNAVQRSDATVNLSSNANDTDTIGNNGYNLFVFSSSSALRTDNSGHVTGLDGKVITFRHNKLDSITPSYGTSNGIASVGLAALDTLGNTKSATIYMKSESLSVTGDSTNNCINIELQWGTF